MEEYLACRMYPLSARVSIERVADGVTPVSMLKLPLPKFHAKCKDDVKILVCVELEAQGVVGSYIRLEHDVSMVGISNGGQLNWVFELAGVLYGPRLVPGTCAFTEASRKRKMDAARKMPIKRVKAPRKNKAISVNIVVSRAKSSSK
jgi:hypothetical protein